MSVYRPTWIGPSSVHGFGLFAYQHIAAGTYLGDYEGPVVEEDGPHVLWVEGDDGEWVLIDGQNALRYMNHSFEPNAEFDGVELHAIRDISPGEEITIHYGEEWEPEAAVPDEDELDADAARSA